MDDDDPSLGFSLSRFLEDSSFLNYFPSILLSFLVLKLE